LKSSEAKKICVRLVRALILTSTDQASARWTPVLAQIDAAAGPAAPPATSPSLPKRQPAAPAATTPNRRKAQPAAPAATSPESTQAQPAAVAAATAESDETHGAGSCRRHGVQLADCLPTRWPFRVSVLWADLDRSGSVNSNVLEVLRKIAAVFRVPQAMQATATQQ